MTKKYQTPGTIFAAGAVVGLAAGLGIAYLVKKIREERYAYEDYDELYADEMADCYGIDVNEDGEPDAVAMDTTGDGKVDTVIADTTGDGKPDTAFVDTDGDGVVDEALDISEENSDKE